MVTPSVTGASVAIASQSLAQPDAVVRCAVNGAPSYPAYDPVDKLIYVPNEYIANITVVKAPCTVVKEIALPVLASTQYAAFNPQDNEVYVTDSSLNQVYVISGTTVVATIISVFFNGPLGIVYDPGLGGMLVANYNNNNILGIEGTSLITSGAVGSGPTSIAIDPILGNVLVSNSLGNSLSFFSTTNWYYSSPTVAVKGTGTTPTDIVYSPSVLADYTTNFGSNNVTVLASTTNVVTSVNVGSGPQGDCYSGSTQDVYVVDSTSHNVYVLNGTTVVKIITLPRASYPTGCVYDDSTGNIYVTGFGSNELYLLP